MSVSTSCGVSGTFLGRELPALGPGASISSVLEHGRGSISVSTSCGVSGTSLAGVLWSGGQKIYIYIYIYICINFLHMQYFIEFCKIIYIYFFA